MWSAWAKPGGEDSWNRGEAQEAEETHVQCGGCQRRCAKKSVGVVRGVRL